MVSYTSKGPVSPTFVCKLAPVFLISPPTKEENNKYLLNRKQEAKQPWSPRSFLPCLFSLTPQEIHSLHRPFTQGSSPLLTKSPNDFLPAPHPLLLLYL